METATANPERNGPYAILRLGFIFLLIASPLLPYLIIMTYNNLLFVTLPAQVKSLPIYPGAKLHKEFLRQDTQSGNCLQLHVQYRNGIKSAQADVRNFYDSALLAAGWRKVKQPAFSERYEKSTLNVRVFASKRRITLSLTVDTFPVFQLGCLP